MHYIRICGALLLPLVWLVWVVSKIAQHDSADHILMLANAVALFVVPAHWIAPPGYQKSKLFFGLGVVVFAVWAACFWHFASADTHKKGLLVVGGLLALGIAIWLAEQGYGRWKAIEAPVARVFAGTAVITIVAVPLIGATAHLLARMFDTVPKTNDEWMVTVA
ncbi:MAG: hypothetical protein JF615_17420, partial [Asticcacaulis sp.]|nr:hypothetical protein [Asticcacaulis sp.]